MRLLLLGEGERDIGRPDTRRVTGGDFEGDLPRLLRKLFAAYGGPRGFGYDASGIRDIVSAIPRGGRAMRTGGKGKDLRDAVLASLRSLDARTGVIIALIDARLDELDGLRGDVQEILRQCADVRSDVHVAIGLAVQEIEVWMLADPASRDAAFGVTVARQTFPSALEDVADPKTLWRDRAARTQSPDGMLAELFEDTQRRTAWEALDPDVVAHACPRGFRPFRDAVRTIATAITR